MKRSPFVLKLKEGKKAEGIKAIKSLENDIRKYLCEKGVCNFSIWGIADFLFCYGEFPDENITLGDEEKTVLENALSPYMEMFAPQGTLPLMYHDIGVVREDKSLIRHRVFSTKLKDGCAPEYKRRHDVLIEQRGDKISDGPETNFTIWNANGYIFGYCELVRSYDHEMTEEEKQSKIAWETRQLEIMDWLTDDVDWITGEKHDAIELIMMQ